MTRAWRWRFTMALTFGLVVKDVQIKQVPRFWDEVVMVGEGRGEGVERQSIVAVDSDTVNLKLDWDSVSTMG
jgi:hypothetical protein